MAALKCWILAGTLALVVVCSFIGVTLWLGLDLQQGQGTTKPSARATEQGQGTSKLSARYSEQGQGTSNLSSRSSEQGQGTSNPSARSTVQGQETINPSTRSSEHEQGTTNPSARFSEQGLGTSKPSARSTYQGQGTSKPSEQGQGTTHTIEQVVPGKEHREEAIVEEVVATLEEHQAPLYPQPIPETPSFVPLPPLVPFQETKTSKPEPYTERQTPTFPKQETSTEERATTTQKVQPTTYRPVPTYGAEKLVSSTHRQEEAEEEDLHYLDSRLREDVFMPQQFDYPHDREPIRHSGEVLEDAVDREGVPGLDPESLFYSPERYDGEEPESAENPFTSFLQSKLHDLYTWLSTDEDLTGKGLGGDLVSLVAALNQSMAQGDSSILLTKLRDMYYNESQVNVTDPAVLHNSSSLVSFGLLAFDLLLLRNVQHIAWEEDQGSRDEMLRDPEVLALNALFLPPDKIRQLQEPSTRVGKDSKDEDSNKSVFQEILEFLNGSLRAVLNLGRAYRSSVSTEAGAGDGNPLDCIWTLYCRNLDKTARMRGPYGFLARMNSLGLRVVMGQVPLEHALEQLLREVTQGQTYTDCEKLFPKCKVSEATDVVMKTALGINTVDT